MKKLWYVYILSCADGSLYTGVTVDLDRRIAQHDAGTGARYTRSHGPVKLVFFEEAESRSAAQVREAAIKKLGRVEKEVLIATSKNITSVS